MTSVGRGGDLQVYSVWRPQKKKGMREHAAEMIERLGQEIQR
jgi:hypothetical protein